MNSYSQRLSPVGGPPFGSQLLVDRSYASGTARRARFYRLTKAGRKQLDHELSEFQRVIRAIGRVIQPA